MSSSLSSFSEAFTDPVCREAGDVTTSARLSALADLNLLATVLLMSIYLDDRTLQSFSQPKLFLEWSAVRRSPLDKRTVTSGTTTTAVEAAFH
jgi:hypothetical protein